MICGSCFSGDHQCDHDRCTCARCNDLVTQYDGPLVHVDWQVTPEEWAGLRVILLNHRNPFIDRLLADGALAGKEQPPPTINEYPAVQDLVMADMQIRKALGIQRYGTSLQPHNGRDALRDLYEELLDACNYIRQVMYERDGR